MLMFEHERESEAIVEASGDVATRVGALLECTASVVSGGARVAFAEAEVVDDRGTIVARASSTYLFTPRE